MVETYFNVLGLDKQVFNFGSIHETLHFSAERKERHLRIVNGIGSGKQVYSFIVDKGHMNGNEIHTIFDNGIIVIRNERTNLLITELIARPGQIRRYWEERNLALPIEIYRIIAIASEHQRKGYNQW